MKFSKMVTLAVKWTFQERMGDLCNYTELHEQQENERFNFCLYQALSAGDKDRYNRLIATGAADC